MEIISYVLEGGLAHRDSMGNGSVIQPGDVQRMSAGTGVTHSEYNASDRESVHFLQIWIEPNRRGVAPGYEEKRFEPETKRGRRGSSLPPTAGAAASRSTRMRASTRACSKVRKRRRWRSRPGVVRTCT
jgi:redox-sensitive bicupin YhaK (pirin superfamily)